MAISRRLLEETELIQPGIWNEPMQRVICPTLVRSYLAGIVARVLSYTHTPRCHVSAERERTRRYGSYGCYLIAPVFHRPRHCLFSFPVPFTLWTVLSSVEARSYGRVQRRVNANFTRSITFSTWIIRYSWRACAPTRGVTFQADRSRGRISNNASL